MYYSTVNCLQMLIVRVHDSLDRAKYEVYLGVQSLGPISQMIFIRNSNSMEILSRFHRSCCEVITIKFCTWDESCAVMARAKFCSDMIPYNEVTFEIDFPSNLNYDGKIFHEMGPDLCIILITALLYSISCYVRSCHFCIICIMLQR